MLNSYAAPDTLFLVDHSSIVDMMRRKLRYAGHVLRGSSGLSHLQILEGPIEGKRGGFPKKDMDEGYS